MIPYFEQPSLSIGPLTIHAFGVLVALAVAVGLHVGERRFARVGLDRALGERMAWWLLIGGFLGAHLFSVLFYFPEKVAADPLVLARVWEDISSFGGILGGAIAGWAFFRFRARGVDAAARLAYLDVAAFVFPIALLIGRVGCALAHDHPGTVTSFPLAVSLSGAQAQEYIGYVYAAAGRVAELPPPSVLTTLGFHDLGLYEMMYLALLVVPAMLLLSRRVRTPGFYLGTFIVLYMPARFMLDFVRVADARYMGLTPAQWVALLALAGLAALRVRASIRWPLIWVALAGAAAACGRAQI